MSGCVFCAILSGEQPGSLFYADNEVVGLLDINIPRDCDRGCHDMNCSASTDEEGSRAYR